MQIMNFASKLCVFLVDIKVKEIMPMLFQYIIILFEEDKDFSGILERFLTETRVAVYDALVDKSIITSMNQIEGNYLEYGDRLYYYLRDGVLHTRELCKEYNLSIW